MFRLVLVRLSHVLLSLFFLLLMVFALVRLTGDPINFLLPPQATPETEARLRAELGLDEPLPVQFAAYLGQLSRGDLGISFRTKRPVAESVAGRLPATLAMGAAAVGLTVIVGLPLGIYAAYWRGSPVDAAARLIAAVGQAVPDFWVGLMLILVFAVFLRWLPSGGYGGIENLILPAITLAITSIAGLIRLLRSSMIEVLESDYVLFHRMKGLPESAILWKHALRNAGLTTLSFVGLLSAGLFTGSVLVETIFNWPGIGLLLVEGIRNRDFGIVQGVLLAYATAFIAINLLVDLLYTVMNPRLR